MSTDEPRPDAGERPGSLAEWRRVWEEDRSFAAPVARRGLGRLKGWIKGLLRTRADALLHDLWERQRQFNLALAEEVEAVREARLPERIGRIEERLDHLEGPVHAAHTERVETVARELQQVQRELAEELRTSLAEAAEAMSGFESDLAGLRDKHLEYLQSHADRLVVLEGFKNDGLDDIMRHADALYARVDQKLDHYRRRSRDLWSRLEGLLAAAERDTPAPLVRAAEEQGYVELERVFRGSEKEIRRRLAAYLGYLEGRAPVLDLGCGRGESLELLRERGVEGRGVDSSAEMVAQCRDKGLEAEQGDLFEALAGSEEGSLGAILSFHVIEHLPPESLDRLVRLAWRALRPGGVLILETPSPLSLVVAARNFWLDPTHRRPVHPDSLELSFQLAGFEPVVRVDLQPFADEDRLPEVRAEDVPPSLEPLVAGVNRLRDRLDELLYGYQDFGMVGFKPGG